MKENATLKIKGGINNIAQLIGLTAEQWPKVVEPKPDLYVSPAIYKLGLKAIKDNETGFYKIGKTPYFRGFRIVKYNPKF